MMAGKWTPIVNGQELDEVPSLVAGALQTHWEQLGAKCEVYPAIRTLKITGVYVGLQREGETPHIFNGVTGEGLAS